jgi:hypothetical protein
MPKELHFLDVVVIDRFTQDWNQIMINESLGGILL